MCYRGEANGGFLVLCKERGERKLFLDFFLRLIVLIWGPVSFELILDLPNTEPCAPGGACCCLVSSSGHTARCVVTFRSSATFPGMSCHQIQLELILQKRPSLVYLKKKKSYTCLSSCWNSLEKSQLTFRQRMKAVGQTWGKQGENRQFPFPHSLLSSLGQDLLNTNFLAC